ncbi:MAG: 16S rRNA (adenine(1518)-N(6)/adenine(1519)-N(6))-dimethyltransferase RsmA [Anaerolineales bacterium]
MMAASGDTSEVWRPKKWHALLRRHNIRPDKRLGQNFLLDPASLNRILGVVDLEQWPVVLEIGAGVGSLTRTLARQAQRVVAVEFDRRLLPALQEAIADLDGVELVFGDFLDLRLADLMGDSPYAVAANIPYNITSAVIRKLLEAPNPPGQIVLTVQREVAERIVAGPGDMSLLALSVQLYGTPSIEARLPASVFYPSPKVDSAVLRIEFRSDAVHDSDQIETVFDLARAGFGQRRKQLRNSLEHGLPLDREQVSELLGEVGIDPKRRPQSLSIAEWKRLATTYSQRKMDGA